MLQVYVRCILEQDPLCLIDESILRRADELTYEKVEYLLKLIKANYRFTMATFKGGVTKEDVEITEQRKGRCRQRKVKTTATALSSCGE